MTNELFQSLPPLRDKERAAQGATSTQDGKVEQIETAVSASNDT